LAATKQTRRRRMTGLPGWPSAPTSVPPTMPRSAVAAHAARVKPMTHGLRARRESEIAPKIGIEPATSSEETLVASA
jgi:hypothetical protein